MLFEYLNASIRKDSTGSMVSVDSIETVDSFELTELDETLKKEHAPQTETKIETRVERENEKKTPLKDWNEIMVNFKNKICFNFFLLKVFKIF